MWTVKILFTVQYLHSTKNIPDTALSVSTPLKKHTHNIKEKPFITYPTFKLHYDPYQSYVLTQTYITYSTLLLPVKKFSFVKKDNPMLANYQCPPVNQPSSMINLRLPSVPIDHNWSTHPSIDCYLPPTFLKTSHLSTLRNASKTIIDCALPITSYLSHRSHRILELSLLPSLHYPHLTPHQPNSNQPYFYLI